MLKKVDLFRGIRYKNWFVYNFLLFLRFRTNYSLRYRIAAEYVEPGESVLDVCSGAGDLKRFLPEDCAYSCIDASPQFLKILSRRNINAFTMNLHEGIDASKVQSDVCMVLVALCQFKTTSMDSLLEDFKRISKKIVVLEHVASKERQEGSLSYKLNNYLIATDFTVNDKEFTAEEFRKVMLRHGYSVRTCAGGYAVGYYNLGQVSDGSISAAS